MSSPLGQYFWLICGLWGGLGNGIFIWLSLRNKVTAGAFTKDELHRFVFQLALWILVPCLILWVTHISIDTNVPPEYWLWPYPQKLVAIALQVFIWLALLYWVFLNNGANILSKYYASSQNSKKIMLGPTAFKLLAAVMVLSSVFALVSTNA
jgi:succinate dehydrogenase hydrophobic anchor subunit